MLLGIVRLFVSGIFDFEVLIKVVSSECGIIVVGMDVLMKIIVRVDLVKTFVVVVQRSHDLS